MLFPVFWKRYARAQAKFPTVTDLFEVTLLVVGYFTVGISFYMKVEGWTFVDSFYFSMVTMSTVGYGDLSPTKAGSKFFTILFVIFGITVPFVRLSNVVATIGFTFLDEVVSSWADSYAEIAYGISASEAAATVYTCFYVGAMLGGVGAGLIADCGSAHVARAVGASAKDGKGGIVRKQLVQRR